MARTMKWPPTPVNGRIPFVEGIDATNIIITQTLGDLQQNPFNDPLLSMGDLAFKDTRQVQPRVEGALRRITQLIELEAVDVNRDDSDEGKVSVTIYYQDREVRQRSEVTVNG